MRLDALKYDIRWIKKDENLNCSADPGGKVVGPFRTPLMPFEFVYPVPIWLSDLK